MRRLACWLLCGLSCRVVGWSPRGLSSGLSSRLLCRLA